jgi:succinoglycan biosynthesis transport protein ExoP
VALDELIAIVWRRRVVFAVTLVVALAAVVAATVLLPRVYESTATLYVGGAKTDAAEDVDTNFGQQLTRTYATIAGGATVADDVRLRLPGRPSRDDLLGRMSFAPVEETRLLQITAGGSSAAAAQRTANVYADRFVARISTLLQQGRAPAEVTLIEPASRPASPARPNGPLYIGLGALLSILIGAAVALLTERLDKRLRVAETDSSLLDVPIRARVPLARKRNEPAFIEAFRLLKINLELSGEPSRIVVVTSVRNGEGKSTVTRGLARAIRGDGEGVVVVDADLRRSGGFHAAGGNGSGAVIGLAQFLAGEGSARDVLLAVDDAGTSFVPVGPAPRDAPARLRPERFGELIDRLLEDFAWVLIDAPAIEDGADSLLLASRAETALLVVDPARSTPASLESARHQLWLVGAGPAGVVLNRVNAEWTPRPEVVDHVAASLPPAPDPRAARL